MVQRNERFIITVSLLLAALVAAGTLGSPVAAQGDTLTASETIATSWLFSRSQKDWAALDTLLASDIVVHNPFLPEALQGAAAVKEWAMAAGEAFSNLAFEVEHLASEGDFVGVHYWTEGTFAADYLGLAATGAPVAWAEIDILRIVDGKIAEIWMGYDTMTMAQQLGIVPAADGALAEAEEEADTAANPPADMPGSDDLEANKALIRSFKLDLINVADFSLVPEYVTANFVYHDRGDTRDVSYSGYAGVEQWLGPLLAIVPDTHFLEEELLLVAENDLVFAHWQAHGTNSGSVEGITATGDELLVPGVSIYRVEDGKIAETWFTMDTLGFLQQLGVIPRAQ